MAKPLTIQQQKIKNALIRLLQLHTESIPFATNRRQNPMYEKGDEAAPFFTETFLYNLVGKDDARTILHAVDQLGEALGYDVDGLRCASPVLIDDWNDLDQGGPLWRALHQLGGTAQDLEHLAQSLRRQQQDLRETYYALKELSKKD